MKVIFAMILAVSALLASQMRANAAASAWQDITGGRIRIVIAEPAPGEKNVQGMLQVDLQPGWKTYWRDPGDAGVPLQVDVSKSNNASLLSIQFPSPQRFDDGVSVWAGYQEPVTFVLNFERTDTNRALKLAGNAFLGVCEKICVPVQFDFSLDVEDTATPTMHHELVAMALKDMPQAANPEFGIVTLTTDWHTISIEAFVPKGSSQAELYLAAPSGFQFTAPELKLQQGGKAHFEAAFLIVSRKHVPDPKMVAYTLVTDKGAVSGEVPLFHN